MSDDVSEPGEEQPKKPRHPNLKARTPIKLTVEQIAKALESNCGMVARAARKLKVSSDTLRQRIRKSEVLQRVRDEVREASIDLAEDNLVTILNDPGHKDHFQASKFVLHTLGRERGYNDQIDLNIGSGEPKVVLFLPQKDPLPGSPPSSEPKG